MRRGGSSHDSIAESGGRSVRDALFGGSLIIWQPARGYRVNVDTLLLARFAATVRPRARRIVDLGSGVGGLALSYAFLAEAECVDLIERDASLADLASRNLSENRVRGTSHIVDVGVGVPRDLRAAADVVLSNPPFFEATAARQRRSSGEASRSGPLGPFLRAAHQALGRRAAAFFVYPARSFSELLEEARTAGLVPKRLRFVHAFAESPARLALVELRRAKPGGLLVEPPIVEWSARGVRSSDLAALVAGKL